MKKEKRSSQSTTGLRSRAEARAASSKDGRRPGTGAPKSVADTKRLLHELQVHQVELEIQNEELQQARDGMEKELEKYSDLYDFAPVGYFSVDGEGRILEVNLTGAGLLGVERSQLLHRRLQRFVAPGSKQGFQVFLHEALAGVGKQNFEAKILMQNGTTFWAGFSTTSAVGIRPFQAGCRVSVSDLTTVKEAEESRRRVDILAAANVEANREIARRRVVETTLRNSEKTQGQLLAESRALQAQLRLMTHKILEAQEEERKNISRELHDEVAQILAGINVQLAALKMTAADDPRELRKRLDKTHRLVGKSIDIVHRFARELRPTLLDDLGLIPALRAYIRDLPGRRRLRVHFTAFSGVEGLDNASRTVLYRVAQEALTNIVRHAKARVATVRIRKLPHAVRLEVRDDGKSFPVERMLAPGTTKRLGLLGMRERVEMVGGTFVIESERDKGTTVRAEVPSRSTQRKSKS